MHSGRTSHNKKRPYSSIAVEDSGEKRRTVDLKTGTEIVERSKKYTELLSVEPPCSQDLEIVDEWDNVFYFCFSEDRYCVVDHTKLVAYGGESSGLDLPANIRPGSTIEVEPKTTKWIDTGVKIRIPSGSVGFIKSRSGLFRRHLVSAFEGTIDPGYLNSIAVGLTNNHPTASFTINSNERIAQLVVIPRCAAPVYNKKIVQAQFSNRGMSGFGSSGLESQVINNNNNNKNNSSSQLQSYNTDSDEFNQDDDTQSL